jgi:hypothetical protein
MDEMENRSSGWGRFKFFAGLVALAFAVALAVVVGNRLSDEALAVLAGAVCGVGAAIPTSLLIVAVSRRRDEERVQPSPLPTSQGVYPPVVVVAPPAGQQRFNDWSALPSSLNAPVQRQFTVVGGAPVNAEVMTHGRYS